MLNRIDVLKLSAIGILTIIAYIPTLIWMYDRWTVTDTYYSHGFLVPLISAYIVWAKRKEFKNLDVCASNSGWLFFLIGILIHSLSTLFRISSISGFALLSIIPGIILLTLGKQYLKKLLFPVFFLSFMIPLPQVAIVNISFRLKLLAAQISTFVINNLGVRAVREGSIIRTAHAQLMVEDPCSGIRSLIALIALGALMAYFSNLSKIKKTILFISSIPIAIATNIIRIVALSLASEIYGEKSATGLFHDTMGILVFVFAFLGLLLVNKLLE
ncbi:MAG: exosortase/archaeosortase family protein [Candidatus Omnitrophota bacterium]